MSSRIPILSSRVMIRALELAGFIIQRQKGSHVILKNNQNGRRVVVSNHSEDLHKGIIAAIVDQAGLTIEKFQDLL